MSELPTGWVTATLGQVASKIGSGATPTGGEQSYKVSGIPLIRSLNVHFDGVRAEGLAFLDEAQAAKLNNVIVEADDVLLNITGASIGRVAVAPVEYQGARVNQHVSIIRLVQNVLPNYVCSFLASPTAQEFITRENYGATRQALTKSMIEDFAFPLAPLAEQKRIVAKLDALNAKSARARAELTRIETLAFRYKQAVLSKAFGGELTRKWPLVPLDRLSESIFDGPFGSNLKSSDYTPDGPRVIRLENIGARTFVEEKRTHISEEKFRALAKHLLQADDLLFSSFVSEEIRACLFPADLNFKAINKADCFCIRLDKTKMMPQFALFQLTAEATYTHFLQKVHGATRPRINLSQLRHYPLFAPPLEEQREIVHRIETAFGRIDRLAEEARRALSLVSRLDEAILAKAFRGELVLQNENDEPAESLLTRIRAELKAEANEKPKSARRKITMLTAKSFLDDKMQRWPEDGVSFQDLKGEFSGSYDDLKDAVFASISDDEPMLHQVFDEKRSLMMLRKNRR